jgi:hypothetical protein
MRSEELTAQAGDYEERSVREVTRVVCQPIVSSDTEGTFFRLVNCLYGYEENAEPSIWLGIQGR